MTTMSPDERMEFARERLDSWLRDVQQLEHPIENDLDNLTWRLECLEKEFTRENLNMLRLRHDELRKTWSERL